MSIQSSNASVASTYPGSIDMEAMELTRVAPAQFSTANAFRTELREHQYRVGELSKMLASRVGFPAHYAAIIGQAAALHDIGKLFVRSGIFQKTGRLTASEEAEARTHTTRGHWALRRGHDPISKLAARIALEHHEHWDGTGYPRGLKGTDICREARVVTICDAYAQLREARSYKPALSHEEAMTIMLCGDDRIRPTMFDPTMLAVFLMHQDLFRKWWDSSSSINAAAA